jgi:fermentation-respiration switch protein FrsA (DUF1100 family)
MFLGIAAGALGILIIGAVCYAPVLFFNITVRRSKPRRPGPAREEPAAWLDTRPGETVSIVSDDGLTLRAAYVAAPGRSVTAILAHGYRGTGRELSPYARFFYDKLGYNVLLPDARGHGASEGAYIGFGWHERLDYLRWIDWVKTRIGASARIVLFGLSMGGATVMMTAGEILPPGVKAVIEDCGYTSAEDELRHVLRQRRHVWGPWLVRITDRQVRKRAGYSFAEASCLNQVKKSKTPILFIHGDADTFVPAAMVFSLYDACGSEKDIYVVKGAGHAMSYETDPAAYENRIAEFLGKYNPTGPAAVKIHGFQAVSSC